MAGLAYRGEFFQKFFGLTSESLRELITHYKTPLYLYSAPLLEQTLDTWRRYLGPRFMICYAIKANANPILLQRFQQSGFGADVVSLGELKLAVEVGFLKERIIFSGVGKTKDDIDLALMESVVLQVESVEELFLIEACAREQNRQAILSLRINPNIDVKTNPYIATGLYKTKFGIAESDLGEALEKIRSSSFLILKGLGCHIGSQILDLAPFEKAAQRLHTLYRLLSQEGFQLSWVDLGGGLGIAYEEGESPPSPSEYIRALSSPFKNEEVVLVIEPGRCLIGPSALLLTQVILTKKSPQKRFAIVDCGMNDLLRPALYRAYHRITPLVEERRKASCVYDVVGPICETGDFIALERELLELFPGDVLAIHDVGAYGYSMSSNYNLRPKPCEVLWDGKGFELIRKRQSLREIIYP